MRRDGDRRDRPGRRARVHRPAQPLGADDLRRSAPRAEGAPGRDDRGRSASTASSYAPIPTTTSRRSSTSTPGSTAARNRVRLGRRVLPRPPRRPRAAVMSPSSSATRRSGSAPSAGTRSPPTAPNGEHARMLREAMEEGAFGLSLGPRLPARRLRDDRRARRSFDRGRARAAASTTRTSATRSATATSTRSARRSRSGAAAGRRPHHPLLPPATFPGGPSRCSALVDDARAEGLDVTFDTYPYEWASTRLLIHVPPWVQAGGPVPTKERLADPGLRERIRASSRSAASLYAGRRRGTTSGSGISRRPRSAAVGGPHARRGHRGTGRDAVDVIATSCSPRISA